MALDAGDIEYVIDVKTGDLLSAQQAVDKFTKKSVNDFNKVDKAADSLKSKITSVASAIAGAFAVGQLSAFVTQTSAAIDVQKKFADRIQVSYEELQKLQFVAGQTGVGTQAFNTGLQRMTRRLATVAQGAAPEVSKQLDRLGINIKDIQDLKPDQQFLMISDAMKTLATDGDRTAAAFAIFDTEGVGLTNTLRMGSEEIKKLMGVLGDIGGVISAETAADFEAFNDKLDITDRAIEGIKVSLLASMLPSMSKAADGITELAKDGEFLESVFNGIGTAAVATATVLTAKMLAAFGSLIAQQAVLIANTYKAAAAQATYNGALGAGAARAGAMAAASKGLSVAMGALGGPLGVFMLAAYAAYELATATTDAEEALDAMGKAADESIAKLSKLKQLELQKLFNDNSKAFRETSKALEEIKAAKLGETDFAGLNAQRNKVDELNKKLEILGQKSNELSKAAQNLGLKINIDKDTGEVTLSEIVSKEVSDAEKVVKEFKKSGKKLTIDDFVDFVSSAKFDVMSPLEKINEQERLALDELKELYKQFPEYSKQYTEAAKAIDEKYAKDRKDLTEKEAEDIRKANEEKLKRETDYKNKVAQIRIDEINKKIAILQRFRQIEEENRQALSTDKENEKAILISKNKEIDAILEKGVISPKQAQDQKNANQLIYLKKLIELNNAEIDEEDRKAKELADKKKAATDFGSTFTEQTNTPLQNSLIKEQEAKDKLSQLYKDAYGEQYESMKSYQEQLTALEKVFSDERIEIAKRENEEKFNSWSNLSGAMSGLFGQMANAIKESGNENSKAYKAMFAISKGFAVAQAGLNFSLALTNALASGPWPQNMAAIASVASTGGALVGAVSSAVYSGRANGGPTSAGNMYKVNENGIPEVYSYGNSDYLMSGKNGNVTKLNDYMEGMGGGNLNVKIINQTSARIDNVDSQWVSRDEVVLIIKEQVPAEIANVNSRTSQSLANNTNSQRRLT